MSKASSDQIINIKEQLAQVLSSLSQFESRKKPVTCQQTQDKMAEVIDNTNQSLQVKLSDVRAELCQSLQDALTDFNIHIDTATESLRNFNEKAENPNPINKLLIEKVHKKQSAPISKLLYSKDFQTIYNIFLAILLNFGIAELARDLWDNNNRTMVTLFIESFGRMDAVITTWAICMVWSYVTTVIVQMAAMPFVFLLSLHLASLTVEFYLAISFLSLGEMPIASSFIVLCESIRCAMKMHSYFREKFLHGNGPNIYAKFVPSYAKGLDPNEIVLPKIKIRAWPIEIKQFTYYHFAPTLIYRDQYPKLERPLRLWNLSVHLFDVFGAIIYTTLIFKAYCVPEFQSASENIKNSHALILSWFRAMLPGTVVFLMLFFAVIHSWFSVWAEILSFADRKFYDDWWNAKDFGTFIRKISVIIYEWLHSYIFIDIQRFTQNAIGPRLSRFIVFVFSGIMAESLLDLSLGFFFPYVFFIIATPGAFMISINNNSSKFYNILIWMLLIMVMGLLVMLYSLEYYCVHSHPDQRDFHKYGNLAYFIPQWTYPLK